MPVIMPLAEMINQTVDRTLPDELERLIVSADNVSFG